MSELPRTRRTLEEALAARSFSAVSAEIGRTSGAIWTLGAGALSFETARGTASTATIFDLASLTKVLATTNIALRAVATGGLDLDAKVKMLVPEWTQPDRTDVSLRQLLEHSSGLPAHREYFRHLAGRDAFARAIAEEPLEYAPGEKAVYSDLGFVILGFALERFGARTLDVQFDDWRAMAEIEDSLAYRPPAEWKNRTAATERDEWRGRLLQGEVHDENAAALDGVAAHAGLFGTAATVGQAARWWLRLLQGHDDRSTGVTATTARQFVRRSRVAGSSRALGWDTMLPTSSCGTRMSARAIGHTGFTGTSLWIDPEQDFYFVLLTNRVHPTRKNDTIQQVRRAFHDAAVDELAHVPDNA